MDDYMVSMTNTYLVSIERARSEHRWDAVRDWFYELGMFFERNKEAL